jgi:hypothetical protein
MPSVAKAQKASPFISFEIREPGGFYFAGRLIELPSLRAAPIQYFRHLGEINLGVGLGGDRGDFPLPISGGLLDRLSFPALPQPALDHPKYLPANASESSGRSDTRLI